MGNYIKEIVRKYTIKYDTRNPFKLADCLGIEVQFGTPGCAGCYMFLNLHARTVGTTINETVQTIGS